MRENIVELFFIMKEKTWQGSECPQDIYIKLMIAKYTQLF